MFDIKPLEWSEDPLLLNVVYTDVLEHTYCVKRNPRGNYYWSITVADEYDRHDRHECESIEAGKLAAEQHWRSRIMTALVEVKQ